MLVAAGTPGIWTLTVLNPTHNHGPIVEKPRQIPQHKVRKGQLPAVPYDWPHDASFTPYTTALVIIDMQKDCKLLLVGSIVWNELLIYCLMYDQFALLGAIWSSKDMISQRLEFLSQSYKSCCMPSAQEGSPSITPVKVSHISHRHGKDILVNLPNRASA